MVTVCRRDAALLGRDFAAMPAIAHREYRQQIFRPDHQQQILEYFGRHPSPAKFERYVNTRNL